MRREFCKCLAFNFRFLSSRYRPEETLWLKRKRDREGGSQGERGEVIARRWKKGHAKWRVGFTSYGNRGTGSGGGSGGGEDGSGGGSRRRWKWRRRWSSTLRFVWICGGHERERERVQSGGNAFGAQGDDDKSFDKMVARHASATPCRKKRVSIELSSLTSSRDRYALDKWHVIIEGARGGKDRCVYNI